MMKATTMITRPTSLRKPDGPRWPSAIPIAAIMMLSLAACGSGSVATTSSPAGTSTIQETPPTTTTTTVIASTPPSTSADTAETTTEEDAAADVVGTVVQFSDGSTTVELTIDEDNPTVRDFLSMLPLTLTLEEFNGREKIAYLPRELAHEGSSGSDPEDGDLIYYIPWGNIGFYYNTAGIGYSDQTIHLGTYNASLDLLEQLEGRDVTVEIVP